MTRKEAKAELLNAIAQYAVDTAGGVIILDALSEYEDALLREHDATWRDAMARALNVKGLTDE